jgi:cysteine desulfurase
MDGWIYMDNGATTPVDPRVLEAMLPYLGSRFGNAASHAHAYGWEAEEAVEKARQQVARLIGSDPREIVFTSGATESNNMALKGVFHHYRAKGNHIITSAIEHKAVLDPCAALEADEAAVTVLPVDRSGFLDPEAVRAAIRPETILVSVMHANNEIGVVQDIPAIGRICKERGVILHSDAAQSAGKIPLDVNEMGIDLASISAHKLYGPKGVGALFVRRRNPRVVLTPLIDGGGHERGIRSGTLNVPGIVGFGAACEIARDEMAAEGIRVRAMRDTLCRLITSQLEEVFVNGDLERRLPGNLNLSFAYCEGESLLLGLRGLAVSTGSACTSASLEPSHVLKAIGVTEDLAHGSIRFTLGRFNTDDEVKRVAAMVVETVRRLRDLSPLYEMMREGKAPPRIDPLA